MMRLGTLLISCILSVAGMLYVPRAGKSVRPEMSVLAVEDRDGYECRYVEFAVGKDDGGKERVRAYLLVPEGGSKPPEWSIHSAAGTSNYMFIWGMCGENLNYADKDEIAYTEMR